MEKTKLKLKPCPFCGGKAELMKNAFWPSTDWWYVTCGNPHCGVHAETSDRPTLQEAAENWNKRAGE